MYIYFLSVCVHCSNSSKHLNKGIIISQWRSAVTDELLQYKYNYTDETGSSL